MLTHIKILGWIYIATHVLYVLGAVIFFVFFSSAGAVSAVTAGVGLGALLASIGTLVALILLAVGLPGLIVGVYILKYAPWARIAGIVLSFIMLLNLATFGVTFVIGLYGLWVLFNPETVAIFERRIAV
jgi:hypothetical protein